MADQVTKQQRSANMAAVKSRGNKSTEEALARLFRKNRITGWRRHIKMHGTPDFVFLKKRFAVFIDGCFWHGCRQHGTVPKTNRNFWKRKLGNNLLRDKKVDKLLKKKGWKVLHIWEHQLKRDPERVVKSVREFLLR